MLTEPLPTTLDVRKAAVQGAGASGTLKPHDLPRFLPLLAVDGGLIRVELRFFRDEENRYLVETAIEADLQVACQRCLEPMSEHLTSNNTLAVVWTDEQAGQLPRHLEPLVVEGQTCSLWDLVEDELILAMRPFSYHDAVKCNVKIEDFSEPEEETEEGKPNPFNVLAQFKSGNMHQE